METNIVREFDKKISDETIVNIPRKKTYDEIIDELEEEVEELSENVPWNTTEQATEISVDDAAKYSRNKLELFGNTEQTIINLPSGYTQLDYIESTGTQFINLDYLVKQNTKLEIEYQTERIGGNTLFGASNNNMNYYASGLAGSTSQTGQDYPTTIKVSTNLSTEKTSLLWERSQVTYNGNVVVGNFGLENSKLVLFKNRRWPNDMGKVKLYKFIAYDGNIIAANYIPCKNSNNEIGLYDVVSNTFYGNSGTGDLVAGPNYPQPIHVVTGNNSIGVQGKNLFDKNSFTYESGYYNDNGKLVSSTNSGHSTNYIGVDSAKTYTISNLQKIYDNDNNYSTVIRVFYWDSLKNWVSRSEPSLGASSFTFTTPNNCKYITLLVEIRNIGGHVIHNIFINSDTIQIEEGTATSYEPHYHKNYPLDLCVSKNRFNINTSILSTYITNAGATGASQASDLSDYIYVKKGQAYTISYDYETLLANQRSMCFYDMSKTYISGQYYNCRIKSHTITPTQDGYIRFAYDKNCYDIQVEQSDTATEYVSYSSLELCKIENYQDEFVKNNGVWKIPNKIVKIDSYNGETITTPYISTTGGLDIGATIYYVGNAEYTITDETLISELDAIYEHLQLVKGTNNITITSSDLPPKMKLTYMQDLPSRLDKLEAMIIENS